MSEVQTEAKRGTATTGSKDAEGTEDTHGDRGERLTIGEGRRKGKRKLVWIGGKDARKKGTGYLLLGTGTTCKCAPALPTHYGAQLPLKQQSGYYFGRRSIAFIIT
ncbi:uncharacterized protein BO96DRAFT_439852 [Aspergillus niger CBS 101883]|uniref:uncharacterized protein n=1 Tax=Aspergillus lacticoffeatus (strain CBS 101883) TaxID=1450533 RepID=UPI000D8008D2|nr:uncharacterized protein BO96DRAFT_439852 [Aspergillus niger CBS 101883]PYH50499.1 hypothetical protein BO96DRAFT_439852 [Aspergillus niger CBS 101883]